MRALLMAATFATAMALATGNSRPQSQDSVPQSCASQTAFHLLDFWVGIWRVTSGGVYAGTDVVTAELSGCAVIERWSDADGSHGISLFLYDSFAGRWTQTWVTDRATHVGGLKFKTLVAQYPNGGTRFQGMLPEPRGKKPILDRTTLTPMQDGTIAQVIEISTDGGTSWTKTFDATYTRMNP
jgi:hypothetical protein